MSDRPAILGGTPIRPDGPPAWPIDDSAVRSVLQQLATDGSWGRYHGPHCDALRQRLREWYGCEHAILCSSGTCAIELALRGLGVADGDEVILAAYDYKANFVDVLTLGATPVLVDVQTEDLQLNVEQAAAAVTDKTRAVIASHLHGGTINMPRLRQLADEHGFAVVEDACQAHGATVYGRPAGMWGDVGVLSFGGSKLVTAGRGGAILTNRDDVAQRIRLYAHRGNDAYPLSEMQAAVLLPQFDALPERHRLRAANAARLSTLLDGIPGISAYATPDDTSDRAYYKLAFRFDPSAFDGLTRDRFAEAVRAEGIALDPGFPGLHRIHAQRRFRAVGALPHATAAHDQTLVLHHPVLLGDENDLRQIVAAVDKIRRHTTMIAKAME